MKEIGIGVIGFGMMGRTHTYAYQNLPLFYRALPFRVKRVGVCSEHLAKARQAADDFGFRFATADYREILARPDIDAVSICTPNNLHCEMIVAAIKAGKHIYCDKPLVTSREEVSAVLDEMDGFAGVHQVAYHIRYYPAVLRAHQLIAEGKLGRIISFRAAYLHAGSIDANRPAGWKMAASGGGVLLDLGSHVLDLMNWLIGPYLRLTACRRVLHVRRPDRQGGEMLEPGEDSVLILAEMGDGAQGTLEASKIATGSSDELRFEIHGERGAVRFNLMEPDWLWFYDNTRPEQPFGGERGFARLECINRFEPPSSGFPSEKATIGWLRGHVHSVYNFLDCISSGRAAVPSFYDAAYIQEIMAKAAESCRTGLWIDC